MDGHSYRQKNDVCYDAISEQSAEQNTLFLMTARIIVSSAIISFAFSGCALYGPVYKKPPTNSPTSWNSQDTLSYSSSDDLPLMTWWEKFDDPQLDYLIQTALKRNNNIQMAVGQSIAAQGQLEQIELSWIPTVNLVLGSNNANNQFLSSGYNIGFMPSFSLNLFQLIRSIEFAEANAAAANAAKEAVRLTIIGQTAGGYFSYLGQSYLVELQEQLVEDTKNLYLLSQIQYEKGLISLYSLQQYKQQWETAEAQLAIFQNNVVVSRNALRLLLNENPGDIQKGLDFMQLKSTGMIPVNLPSQVLKNRPDVSQAEEQLIAANAQIGIATSVFFPTFSLTGSLGAASPHLNNFASNSTSYWNHQELITQPLLNASALGQIKAAKGEYYSAYHNYVQTVKTAFSEVDNDLSAHALYMASYQAQIRNATSAKEAYSLAEISYKKGLYSYPTLLTNKINWDNAQINLAQAKLAQLNTIVQLYQDLGGGYDALRN